MTKLLAILTMSVLPATAIGATDPHSYAEPDKFLVRHVDLDLRADFEAHRLEGTAELTVEQVDPDADTLSLDTRDLEISSVHLIEMSGRAKVLAFKLGEPDPILGSKLTIEFPHCCAATSQMRIRIAYRTSNDGERAAVARARADVGCAPVSCTARARRSTRAAGSRSRTARASA